MKLADTYHSRNASQPLPHGAVSAVQVVVFEDGSVYIGGPATAGTTDESQAALLGLGLNFMGYKVLTERGDIHPLLNVDALHTPETALVKEPALA